MDVERHRRRLDGREAVVVVERMEELQMQDRRQPFGRDREAQRTPIDGVLIGLRPAVAAGHHLHAVGAQHVQLAHNAIDATAST